MRALSVVSPLAVALAASLIGLPAAAETTGRVPLLLIQSPAAPAPDAHAAPGKDGPGKPNAGTDLPGKGPPVQVEIPKAKEAPAEGEGRSTTSPVESATAEPDRAKRLDALFAALKAAPDEESAKQIAARIDIALTPSGSDTADLLMNRAAQATEAKDYDLAIQLLDGVLAVAPDHLEAWNKRATVFYLKQDFSDALLDLRQVVAREPRHYGAWAGIAIICKEIGDEKHALEAARQALAAYPHLDEVGEMEEELSLTVEGRPI
ncbi:tetratricopeptide repeat protein [Ancylobacter sp. WKF20]|uniref:tetratricopeptide repeat protein n=1 Tax=Ancylobacter sp. WKF20 TaxID=3039801 RepID=UPI0024345DDF|nr:tetratricopeptide repeat protein [Ancylobacter sp. WKF20]WGD28730.1 tetratricopeptide repeat protein [Ancylobacter sp. WKF20]